MKEYLDKIATRPSVVREFYGSDKFTKPNEHCVWNVLEGGWVETDAHLRERLNNETR